MHQWRLLDGLDSTARCAARASLRAVGISLAPLHVSDAKLVPMARGVSLPAHCAKWGSVDSAQLTTAFAGARVIALEGLGLLAAPPLAPFGLVLAVLLSSDLLKCTSDGLADTLVAVDERVDQ